MDDAGAGASDDAGAPADAATDASPSCEDADGDGERSVACGGRDCDDRDPAIGPDATDDAGWVVEEIAERARAYRPSLALGADEAPNHVYSDVQDVEDTGDWQLTWVTVTTGDLEGWAAERLPITGVPRASIAVGRDGVYVAFADFLGDERYAFVATNAAGSWTTEELGLAREEPGVVAGAGSVQVAWTSADGFQLSALTAGAWDSQAIGRTDEGGNPCWVHDLALAPDATARVLCWLDGSLEVWRRSGAAWSVEPVPLSGAGTLAIGPGDEVHVAAMSVSGGGFGGTATGPIEYARWDEDWQTEEIDPDSDTSGDWIAPAVGVTAGGTAVVAHGHSSVEDRGIVVSARLETGWLPTWVVRDVAPYAASVAVGPSGRVHVALLVDPRCRDNCFSARLLYAVSDAVDSDCNGVPW